MCREHRRLGAFIFFNRDVKDRSDPSLVIRTLAYKLATIIWYCPHFHPMSQTLLLGLPTTRFAFGMPTLVLRPVHLSGHGGWVRSLQSSLRWLKNRVGVWLTIRIWNLDTGGATTSQHRASDDVINSVAFSPDGSTIVSGSDDTTIRGHASTNCDLPPLRAMMERYCLLHSHTISSENHRPRG